MRLTFPIPGKYYSQSVLQDVLRQIESLVADLERNNSTDNFFTFRLGQGTQLRNVPFAATQTVYPQSSGSNITITQTANHTLTLDGNGLQAGTIVWVTLVQDATGGRTTTWGASVKWGTGGAPALTTTASTKSVLAFLWDGSSFLGLKWGTGY
jgi:hypothetical protein